MLMEKKNLKNKASSPDIFLIGRLEKKASELGVRLLPIVGAGRMEEFTAEQTNDTMLEGIKLLPDGSFDFSEPERRFAKLPPLWLKLAEKFLRQFIAGLEGMFPPSAARSPSSPIIAVSSGAKEMMARLGFGDLIAKGLIENVETNFKTKSGEMKPVNVSASALRDRSGKIRGMVITAKDLGEIQKLQREKLEITERAKERAEELVRERTAQLKQKIAELERFNNLAVGRELKMIELKKEIARLKAKKPETEKTLKE